MNEPLPNRWLIAPNKLNDEIFEDFYFLMLVMSGKHALYLNNRKYYFSVFTQSFEPVYYDGDFNLLSKAPTNPIDLHPSYSHAFQEHYRFGFKEQLETLLKSEALLSDYLQRVIDRENYGIDFFSRKRLITFSKIWRFYLFIFKTIKHCGLSPTHCDPL